MTSSSTRNTLRDPRVAEALETMFAQAAEDDATHQHVLYRQPANFEALSQQERADAAAEIYMPISRDGGRLVYTRSAPHARARWSSSARPSASPRSTSPPPSATTARAA
jgi:hypothetical protein